MKLILHKRDVKILLEAIHDGVESIMALEDAHLGRLNFGALRVQARKFRKKWQSYLRVRKEILKQYHYPY